MLISWFYSDPHFGHSNIIDYSNRPFRDVQHMTEELTTRYNECVSQEDTVLWCGDTFFKLPTSECARILAGLNGRKILVKGNHDKSASAMARMGFDLVLTECILHIAGRTCRVSHFPYAEKGHAVDRYAALRPPKIKGEVLIHGHTHSDKRRRGNSIHVGVDAWDYRPASLAEVTELIEQV